MDDEYIKIVKNPVLNGPNVILREINYDDTDDVIRWRNDDKMGRFLDGGGELTREIQIKFLKSYFQKDNDFYFIIEKKNPKISVGTMGLRDIDLKSKRAEFHRLIILPDYRLYALEASYLLMQFAFETLNLNKVYCSVLKKNIQAYKFDCALGFSEEGLLKQHWWHENAFDDLFLLAMFKDGYKKLKERYASLLMRRNRGSQL